MIRSFADKRTQAMCEDGRCPAQWRAIERVALRKLDQLQNVSRLDDLRVPPGNRLERLKGNRAGQWSIRINDQYRLCFRWEGEHAFEVEIADYH
ncbi:MAG: type II toxin-antitoxin system RelE/ParE family toxin [Mesorhizobium sp.]|nr:type II toxin-antitoxin system RelE/ParE family toxin [Mesorhizobium sp.]